MNWWNKIHLRCKWEYSGERRTCSICGRKQKKLYYWGILCGNSERAVPYWEDIEYTLDKPK